MTHPLTNHPLLSTIIPELTQDFQRIDGLVKSNLVRVIQAMSVHRVGVHHFQATTGYGHGDQGREVLEQVFAQVMGAEMALVRPQFFSGTHAIACTLYGVLRPGDELLSVAGAPYDTLEPVLGMRESGGGSLQDFGITYRQLDLTPDGGIDWAKLPQVINSKTRVAFIQRSCGYSWRPSLTIAELAKVIHRVKCVNPQVICVVDNCYGEFAEVQEPTMVGADLIAGSLIKNPGGTIAPCGGYVAGKKAYVKLAANRLNAPGIGVEAGASLGFNRLFFQGLFLAPQMVGEALKSGLLLAATFSKLDYPVQPNVNAPRTDTIQAIQFGDPERLTRFCRALQRLSPVGSYLDPVPAPMPGYESQLVMAGGTFIDGSTSEFSADGPLRPPYIVFCQGGTTWLHWLWALEQLLPELEPNPHT
ncbi:aluminum resistance family protein [Gloeomargarita lithophora Alchichica-D10]|uniref:Aluminum resistance family protein n=1 Tax=Gloeomargarita lithophora Alchichica-D10 TaxID=1188229 RepID=A0A1J0AD34_9CYAN|nr:methionine gamma-lyase family protein [Gloeomargarita lithophora]APB33845.1 aluminum resistance family protein [Gloeomargarita lithophora Alchichica-D10]